MTSITVNGNAYSDDGTAANDMRGGGHRTHLLPMVGDVVVVAGEVAADAAQVVADKAAAATSASNAATSESNAATYAAQAAASAASLHGTSTTGLAVGLGSKSFTTQANEAYTAGVWITATSAADIANWMYGQVTSYSGTTLIVDVQVIGGSGTHADWNLSISAARGADGATGAAGADGADGVLAGNATGNISMAGYALNESRGSVAMHATTMDIWAQPNIIDGTGSAVTVTAIANAPAAGARRVLYPVSGSIITNGATFAVDGAANHTAEAGDKWEIEAVTISTYKVHVTKADGTAVVSAGVGDHVVIVHTSNGYGSTNNKIARYTTVLENTGTAITYADSAANGASFTINEPGLYAIRLTELASASLTFGASLNSAQLTTALYSITASNRVVINDTPAGGISGSAFGIVSLATNDVIRPHFSGGTRNASDYGNIFEIRKVGTV